MRSVSAFTGFLVVLAAVLPGYGAEECTANFEVDLTSQEESVLHFEVTVSTDATNARIEYSLLLTVSSASGDSRVVTIPRVVKIGDGTIVDIVSHTLGSGETLSSSDAEQVSCESQS